MKFKILIGVIAFISLSGCAKATEPFKDAPTDGRNSDPAVIVEMPDGFGNYAYKCIGTDKVYTLFHSDSKYGGIAVSPNSPDCNGGPSSVPSN